SESWSDKIRRRLVEGKTDRTTLCDLLCKRVAKATHKRRHGDGNVSCTSAGARRVPINNLSSWIHGISVSIAHALRHRSPGLHQPRSGFRRRHVQRLE